MPTHALPVSFRFVPADRAAEKLDQFARHGWRALRTLRTEPLVYLLAKDSDEPLAERALEQELQGIMGDYYDNIAAPGSPRNLKHTPTKPEDPPGDRQRRLLAEHAARGWQVTPDGEALLRGELAPVSGRDPDVVEETAATVAIRDTKPPQRPEQEE